MARPFFLSNISNWGCSQCFTVKEKAEFSNNQWGKGDAARCHTCVENEKQAAPSVSATADDYGRLFDACLDGRLDEVRSLLDLDGIQINDDQLYGCAPLFAV